jgi:hypothetical protein
MPGCMSADPKRLGDPRVGAALRQKYCHFQLPSSESVAELKVGIAGALGAIAAGVGQGGAVILQLVSKLVHLVERPANLIDQRLAVSSESGEGRQQLGQAIGRHSRLRFAGLSILFLGSLQAALVPFLYSAVGRDQSPSLFHCNTIFPVMYP